MYLEDPADGVCNAPKSDPATLSFVPAEPAGVSYSFTLPADPYAPGIARHATRTILEVHHLAEMADAAVQVVSELTACACRFAIEGEVYVSLRFKEGLLRVTLFDDHPRHVSGQLSDACDDNRCVSLNVLDGVVQDCDGEWGIDGGAELGGTRMWAVLPRKRAAEYLTSAAA